MKNCTNIRNLVTDTQPFLEFHEGSLSKQHAIFKPFSYSSSQSNKLLFPRPKLNFIILPRTLRIILLYLYHLARKRLCWLWFNEIGALLNGSDRLRNEYMNE